MTVNLQQLFSVFEGEFEECRAASQVQLGADISRWCSTGRGRIKSCSAEISFSKYSCAPRSKASAFALGCLRLLWFRENALADEDHLVHRCNFFGTATWSIRCLPPDTLRQATLAQVQNVIIGSESVAILATKFLSNSSRSHPAPARASGGVCYLLLFLTRVVRDTFRFQRATVQITFECLLHLRLRDGTTLRYLFQTSENPTVDTHLKQHR